MSKKKSVLLVDDNLIAQKITAKVFGADGYQVFLAANKEECLKIAKIEKPDAILMDVVFPGGDGREFVKELKQDPEIRNIPIIFATSIISLKDDKGNLLIKIGDECFRAFAKPLHYPKVLSTVRKEINRSRNQKKL
jgi:CheY-like chemotaxis protein